MERSVRLGNMKHERELKDYFTFDKTNAAKSNGWSAPGSDAILNFKQE